MKNLLFGILFILAQSQHSFAQNASISTEVSSGNEGSSNVVSTKVEDVRNKNKYGVYLGLGTPYPSLVGVNFGYNLDDLRITAGYSEIEETTSLSFSSDKGWHSEKAKASTYDVGVEYYFMHGESIRPVAGVHTGFVDFSGSGEVSIEGFKKDTFHAYANAGLDYMSQGGYQFAVGYNQGFVSNGNGNIYVNAGRFF